MAASRVALLTERLAEDIRAGRLAPGTLMPTHRDLAARHGMAVASASKVYARLASSAWSSAKPGAAPLCGIGRSSANGMAATNPA